MQTAQIRKTGPSTSTGREKCFQQLCLQSKLNYVFGPPKPKTYTKTLETSFISVSMHQEACLYNLHLSRNTSYCFFLHTYLILNNLKKTCKETVLQYTKLKEKKKNLVIGSFFPFHSTSVIPQPQADLTETVTGKTKGTKLALPSTRRIC